MNAVGEVAVWLALIAAGWNTGVFGAQWKGPARGFTTAESWSVFAGAAPLALAWASLTGAALRGDATIAAVADRVVTDASAAYRVAAVLSGTSGAILTFAMPLMAAMLVAATRPTGNRPRDGRRVAILSAATMVALAVLVQSHAPFAPAGASATAAVPLELIHPGAALRGLLSVAAAAAALLSVSELVAARGTADTTRVSTHGLTIVALTLATVGVAADQWARASLTSGDSGRNAAGLLLWLSLAVLAHERVRRFLSDARPEPFRSSGGRRGALLSHTGAALLVVAFAAHAVARRAELTLGSGAPVETMDVFGQRWRLVNQGISRYDDERRDIEAVAIQLQMPRGQRLITADLRSYHGRPDGRLLPAVKARARVGGVLQTALITLEAVEANETARVRVAFVPLAVLWYPGVVLLLAGLILAAFARDPMRGEARDVVAGEAAALVRQWRNVVVVCPRCGRRPEPDARFCSSCDRALAPCARCGHVTAEPLAVYCAQCAAPLGAISGRAVVSARSTRGAAAPAAAE